MRTNVPLAVRALRRRRRWRQHDLGARAGLSRDVVSRAERGRLDGITLGSLSHLAAALDAALVVELRWQGADLDRLVDRAHAALEESAARRLTTAGWNVRAEVSFNYYGERGRCAAAGVAQAHADRRGARPRRGPNVAAGRQPPRGALQSVRCAGASSAGGVARGRPHRFRVALVRGVARFILEQQYPGSAS
jgi:transcriptional regulator with XRE-family HTH domain